MSVFAEYRVGAITREEFESECASINNRARWEEAHMYDEPEDDDDYAEDEIYERNNICEGDKVAN